MEQPTRPAPGPIAAPTSPGEKELVVKRDGRVARRGNTREVAMRAATTLFAARGVTSTSIDDIAELAAIAKGSIYYNFGSKAGLVEAIMHDHAELLRSQLAAATEGLSGARLRSAAVRAILLFVHEHDEAAQVIVSELFRTERSWKESISVWRDVALAPLVSSLEAESAGQDLAEVQLRGAAMVGSTLVTGLAWLLFNPQCTFDQVLDAVLSTMGLPQDE